MIMLKLSQNHFLRNINELLHIETRTITSFNGMLCSVGMCKNNFVGVCAYTYEKEAITTEIKISGPAMVSKN